MNPSDDVVGAGLSVRQPSNLRICSEVLPLHSGLLEVEHLIWLRLMVGMIRTHYRQSFT